ncbi:hypothetical protein FNX48_010020 [Streptomyces sp. IF17]|nr:hypothetical protein [Streptomyces alkaliphilus]
MRLLSGECVLGCAPRLPSRALVLRRGGPENEKTPRGCERSARGSFETMGTAARVSVRFSGHRGPARCHR